MSVTRRLVRTSTRRTDSSSSMMVMRQKPLLKSRKLDFFRPPLSAFRSFPRNERSDLESWHGHRIENLLNQCVGGHRLGFGLVSQNDPVPQDIWPDAFDIFGSDIFPPLQQRPGFGGQGEENSRARGTAKLDEVFYVELIQGWCACGKNQVHNVIAHLVIDVNLVDQFARMEDLIQSDHRLNFRFRKRKSHPVQDFSFLIK